MPGEDRDLRCNVCGQGWALRQTDIANQVPPTFCPTCGTKSLVRETGRFLEGATAFKKAPELSTALYVYWRNGLDSCTPSTGTCYPYRRYVDFFNAVLEGRLVLDLTDADEENENA